MPEVKCAGCGRVPREPIAHDGMLWCGCGASLGYDTGTKLGGLRAAWDRGDYRAVLRIAVKFPRLDNAKAAVERAWQALQRPGFVREVARDPNADLAAGLDAIRARYDLPPLGVEPDRL